MDQADIERSEADPSVKHELVANRMALGERHYLEAKPIMRELIAHNKTLESVEDKTALFEDMCYCLFAFGFQPDEYVFFNLKDKSFDERRSYISDIERTIYCTQMNDVCESKLFQDKSRTYRRYEPFFKREAVRISSRKDWGRYLAFVSRHPVFVRKLVDSSRGHGVALVDLESGKDSEILFEELLRIGPCLLEEPIHQSAGMAAFNSSSVNTIRCIAFSTRSGVKVPFAFLKTGRAGSFVDNGGMGGILSGIDETTGVLNTNGIDEAGNTFLSHPESGVVFMGQQLPDWEGALLICREATLMAPKYGIIGWDLAHTDKGWVIVEGNHFGQFVGPQSTRGHGIKADVQALMADMNLMAE